MPERLRAVLMLAAQGLSDDNTATKLSITRNMVRNHVSATYKRLEMRKRSVMDAVTDFTVSACTTLKR